MSVKDFMKGIPGSEDVCRVSPRCLFSLWKRK